MSQEARCHNCLYSYWDKGLWLTSLWGGFPHWPICANHPDHLGQIRTAPAGGPCRNYRPRPDDPAKGACQVPLSDGSYAYVDAADFEWIMRYHWHSYNGGYAVRWEKGKTIYMHREIAKPPKGMMVDHKNHNRADNTRDNLRVCSRRENILNQGKKSGASNRFKGVERRKGRKKCSARIRIDGKRTYLGSFDDEATAARAYDRAAVEHHGEFAYLNFPEEWPPERRAEFLAMRNAEGVVRKTRKKSTRTTQGAPRTTKPSRAETPGRRAKKGTSQSKRATPSKRKTQDAQRTTKQRTKSAGPRTKKKSPQPRNTRTKRPAE